MLNIFKRTLTFFVIFSAVGAIFFAYSALATDASHLDEESTEMVVNR